MIKAYSQILLSPFFGKQQQKCLSIKLRRLRAGVVGLLYCCMNLRSRQVLRAYCWQQLCIVVLTAINTDFFWLGVSLAGNRGTRFVLSDASLYSSFFLFCFTLFLHNSNRYLFVFAENNQRAYLHWPYQMFKNINISMIYLSK